MRRLKESRCRPVYNRENEMKKAGLLQDYEGLARAGLENVAAAFSQMAGEEIIAVAPDLRMIPLAEIPALAGGPDTVVTAIYLAVSGDLSGHITLVLDMDSAARLAWLLLGVGEGVTDEVSSGSAALKGVPDMDPMMRSALEEVGNVVGSAFLNTVADGLRVSLRPSIPYLVIDMAGAVLSTVVSRMEYSGERIPLADAAFSSRQESIKGFLFILPDNEALRYLKALTPGAGDLGG